MSRLPDPLTDPTPLLAALDAAEPKPHPKAARDDKKNYAQRLSNQLSIVIANALRPHFPQITPSATGLGQEAQIEVGKAGRKRLDVKAIDPRLGLILAVSIKTYSFQDYDNGKDRLGRWTKNIVRNDHELRGEAMVLHQRQPYSVLAAVMFEPWEICDDGVPSRRSDAYKSSFAHHVSTLAKRTGRGKRAVYGGPAGWVDIGADDTRYDLFERVFIALYDQCGPDRGAVRFFDVENAPPRNGRPTQSTTLSLGGFVTEIVAEVDRRNRFAPTWADAEDDE